MTTVRLTLLAVGLIIAVDTTSTVWLLAGCALVFSAGWLR